MTRKCVTWESRVIINRLSVKLHEIATGLRVHKCAEWITDFVFVDWEVTEE
jgi:hypothetical protein